MHLDDRHPNQQLLSSRRAGSRIRRFLAVAVAATAIGGLGAANPAAAAEGDRLSADPYMHRTFVSAAGKAFKNGGISVTPLCTGKEAKTTKSFDAYGNPVQVTKFNGRCTSSNNWAASSATCTGTRTKTRPAAGSLMIGGSTTIYSARCVHTNLWGATFTGSSKTTIW
jgi:hypothetical protein